MENIILCPECQGSGLLPRTKKRRKKKLRETGISISASDSLKKLKDQIKDPLKQLKEGQKIEYVICFRCGGLGTISI